MQKPSWCLDVMTTYFIPAALATRAHSLASNFVGLNCLASCSYSAIGILWWSMIHSPACEGFFPFHSPAGTA